MLVNRDPKQQRSLYIQSGIEKHSFHSRKGKGIAQHLINDVSARRFISMIRVQVSFLVLLNGLELKDSEKIIGRVAHCMSFSVHPLLRAVKLPVADVFRHLNVACCFII